MDSLWVTLQLFLSAVTVYPQGARLSYTGSLALKKGYNVYVWTDLPPSAATSLSYLRLALPPTSRAYIVESHLDPYTPTWQDEPADLKGIRQAIDSIEKILARWHSHLALLKAQETTLLENKKLGGEEGPTSAPAVEAYLRLLARELPAIQEAIYPLEKNINQWTDSLKRWREAYLARKASYSQKRSALYLRVWSPQAEVTSIRVELQVPEAAWRLHYLIRVPNAAEGKALIQRRAFVTNRTGIDWKNVQLALSTAHPHTDATLPPFQPWYIDQAPVGRYSSKSVTLAPQAAETADGAAEGASAEEPEAPAPPMPILENATLSRNYTLGTQTLLSGSMTSQFLLKEDTLTGKLLFVINAPAKEEAYLRMGLSSSAYELWEEGQATLDVEGQQVGEMHWPPTMSEDTVWLDLGPSPRITVKRETIRRSREKAAASNTVRYQFSYRLRVSHTYPQPITLAIWDRLPISRYSEIKVDLTESGDAVVDPETGRLSWQVTLEPLQVWEKTFSFTIKAPAKLPIIGL